MEEVVEEALTINTHNSLKQPAAFLHWPCVSSRDSFSKPRLNLTLPSAMADEGTDEGECSSHTGEFVSPSGVIHTCWLLSPALCVVFLGSCLLAFMWNPNVVSERERRERERGDEL